MQFFIFHILIGSAIAYFMQAQIRYIAEQLTSHRWLQAALKIFMDAILSVTWIITAPALLALKTYLKTKEQNEEKTDDS